jgi:hypothetical protein
MMTGDLPQVSVVGEARLAARETPPVPFDAEPVPDVPFNFSTESDRLT